VFHVARPINCTRNSTEKLLGVVGGSPGDSYEASALDEVTDLKHFAYEKIKPPNIKQFSFQTLKDMQVNVKWGLLPIPRLHG